WKRRYRFVIIRRPIPEDPTEQLSLFSMGKFSYQVIVTNMELKPLNIWRVYNGRAAIELIIKELKNDYPLAKIPTKHFAANESYFHILLFSYNLVNWFKRLCLPEKYHTMTLSSLRARLLLIPGELVHSGNRPILKLPEHFFDQDAVTFALHNISKLKL
ncbi:MAG: transposase, partial [Bacteroidota bacterium]